jgi:hypothetical protein
MAKDKDKIDAAIAVETQEDDVALTTKNQDETPEGDQNPKADVTDGAPVDAVPEKEEKTMDEKINDVGSDVPTVPKPKTKPKIKDVEGFVFREGTDRAAILFLAKTLLTPTDLDDFKTLYPSLF